MRLGFTGARFPALDDGFPLGDFRAHQLARLLRRAAARLDGHVVKRLAHFRSGRGGDFLGDSRSTIAWACRRARSCRSRRRRRTRTPRSRRSWAPPAGSRSGDAEPTASAFNWLPLMCDSTGPTSSNATLSSLPRSAVISSVFDLNGTICASMPAIDLKSSAARNCVLPTLIVPILSLLRILLRESDQVLERAEPRVGRDDHGQLENGHGGYLHEVLHHVWAAS